MSQISQQTEWLSMIEVSGPFLAVSVLEKVFPQGLDVIESFKRKRIRSAYDEWCDAIDKDDPRLKEYHREWIRLVLTEILEFDDSILLPYEADDGSALVYKSPDSSKTFAPDFVLSSSKGKKPLLLVSVQPPETDLEKVKLGDGWPASIVERMILLCRTAGARLGLVTNGERWMLVNAPVDNTSSHASWYARIWFQEPVTLKAFQSLLGVRRWFGPEDETLSAMLEESLQHHEEVTDTLGEQVRRAVEVLVQCLDKADQDRNRELLQDVSPTELYETGLTVMMRLVFVLCAEERGLLLLGDPTYDQNYAVTTLRGKLAEEADRHGPEVLERRHDAWSRLLAVFRAIYGGVEQETMRMPALGGSLFDPDRFPFLEGRAKGTYWKDAAAKPLPIDNRTVLLLLNALQMLEQRSGALLLSYKALDVEQIGHVYEGLLEHTVERLPKVTLGLIGSKKAKNPNLTLVEMESALLNGEKAFADLVTESTLRSVTAINNALKKGVVDETFGRVIVACGGDMEIASRIRPFANLLRADAWGDFIVYRTNSFAVTLGADRRETGTHYTPKSLTEAIVETTLEPVAYIGPAEGKPREEWKLKTSAEMLDLKICDPAMGSGAFLVQVCRWLAERVVEAWEEEETAGKFVTVDGVVLDNPSRAEPMPNSLDDRLLIARLLVAEKCLYGVDMNPLAVELAKLSIWLVTLARGRPFGFLDHNLRHGDSLLGIHNLDQLSGFYLKPKTKKSRSIFTSNIKAAVDDAIGLRKKLRETPIRDIRDVQQMERLDKEARKKLKNVEHVADSMIGEALRSGGNARNLESGLDTLSTWADEFIKGESEYGRKIMDQAQQALSVDLPSNKPPRKPFHWALEFPEVFERGGFDGIIGNPPFQGGLKIGTSLGENYRKYLVTHVAMGKKGTADLCAYFFLRANHILRMDRAFGLLATNTIGQGDTREVGLDELGDQGVSIYRARSSYEWPGSAGVTVAKVWAYKGKWSGQFMLDENLVEGISTYLAPKDTVFAIPYRLDANANRSFVGSHIVGMGFVLDPQEAREIIKRSPSEKHVIFSYINGKDFNSRFDQSPSRSVINFSDWPLTHETSTVDYEGPVVVDFPICYSIVEKRVKPERLKNNAASLRRFWWRLKRPTIELYKRIKDQNCVLLRAISSKHHVFGYVENGYVYDQTLIVFPLPQTRFFSILQSSIHEKWAVQYSATIRSIPRYIQTDCFETFPFPNDIEMPKLDSIGETYHEHREGLMRNQQEGLTKIYNRFHDPIETIKDIKKLRKLHAELDQAVAIAYGWDDIDLGHGFHKTKQGIRFTISKETRSEVLKRLLKLNHERYEEEVRQGLHEKKKKARSKSSRGKKKTKTMDKKQTKLF